MSLITFSIVIEGALYSAIAPILPSLTRDFRLTESQAGFLVSGYSAGLVVGSLAAVLGLKRCNTRDVAVFGLLAFTLFTGLFATADTALMLTAARLGQGLSAGILWTASVFWLLDMSGRDRRGSVLGKALSFNIVGTIAGPMIGTLAVQVGIQVLYLTLAGVCLVGAVMMCAVHKPVAKAEHEEVSSFVPSQARSVAFLGLWIIALAGAIAGLINLGGPLIMSRAGASDLFVGLVFVAAALAGILVGGPAGTLTDKRGAALPLSAGLLLVAVLLLASGVELNAVINGAVIVGLMTAVITSYVPGGVMLTRGGEAMGWPLRFAIALSATVWGAGETVGAVIAGYGFENMGPVVTGIAASVVVFLTLIFVVVCTKRVSDDLGFKRGVRQQ